MKNLFLIGLLLLNADGYAQTLTLLGAKEKKLTSGDTITLLKRNPENAVQTLVFKIGDREAGTTVDVTLADLDEGSANLDKDYKYGASSLKPKIISDQTPSVFNIDIERLTNAANTAMLHVTLIGKTKKQLDLVLHFPGKMDEPAKKVVPDTAHWSIRIVTGGNFDFFNSPKLKDFAGDINVFLPNMGQTAWKPLGVQFGVFNYHYYAADSSGRFINEESYFLNPKERLIRPDTTKYVHAAISRTQKTEYNMWGAYVDPIFELKSDAFAQVYLGVHLEALITNEITSSAQSTLYKDTLTVSRAESKTIVLATRPGIPLNYLKRTYYDYYTGAGLLIRANIKKAVNFMAYPMVGIAGVQQTPHDLEPDQYSRDGSKATRAFNPYAMVKFQVSTSVAPVDIALGGEYRSVLNGVRYFPIYIGAALSLDKLKR